MRGESLAAGFTVALRLLYVTPLRLPTIPMLVLIVSLVWEMSIQYGQRLVQCLLTRR